MQIEVKKVVKKEETTVVDLQKFWKIRLIQGVNSFKCVKEIEYTHEPSEQEIASVLVEFGEKNVFATVEMIYKCDEILPF